MGREYIVIEPSSKRPLPEDIVSRIGGLRKIADEAVRRYNPLADPPVFEAQVLLHGKRDGFTFLFGTKSGNHLEAIKAKFKNAYPNSYRVTIEEINLAAALDPYTVVESRKEANKASAHRIDPPGTDGQKELTEGVSGDGGSLAATRNDPDDLSLEDFESVEPHAVQFYGRGERRLDWQTVITRYTQITKRHQRQKEDTKRRQRASPLGDLLDTMMEADRPIAFQVVFYRRRYWGRRRKRRMARLSGGSDGILSFLTGGLAIMAEDAVGGDPYSQSETVEEDTMKPTEDTGVEKGNRRQLISQKGESDNFRVNIRAISLVEEDAPQEVIKDVEQTMESVSNSLNHLSGPFYNILGRVVTDGFRERRSDVISKRPSPEDVFDDYLNRRVRVTRFRRTRLQLTLTEDGLANFVAVPSNDSLTKQSRRGTEMSLHTRSPLKLPPDSKLANYLTDGISIGYPLNERGERIDDEVKIPMGLLNQNFIRSGAIGSGKSVSTINQLLDFASETKGPNILIEPKGGDMAVNYLLSHYDRFGTLNDVIYFHIPETLPAAPFFDIRPMIAAGFSREQAVNNKVNQFDEIMKLVMGEQKYNSAPHSIELIKELIKVNFDEKYGADAFPASAIQETLLELEETDQVPPLSEKNDDIRQSIRYRLGQDSDQFESVGEGAMNRLKILLGDSRMRRVMNYIPEWDNENGEYDEHGFNLHSLIDEDKTIIFDLGDLTGEAKKALALMYISFLWNTVKIESRRQDIATEMADPTQKQDDYIVSCIIDEAKEFAGYDTLGELLSQGREFNLSMGLIMQFPKQVENVDNESNVNLYQELLEDVGTKILGEMNIPDEFADMLSSDAVDAEEFKNRLGELPRGEWIVDIKSEQFFEDKPQPFHVHSLDPPRGHPAADMEDAELTDIRENAQEEFESRYDDIKDEYCVPVEEEDEDERDKHTNNLLEEKERAESSEDTGSDGESTDSSDVGDSSPIGNKRYGVNAFNTSVSDVDVVTDTGVKRESGEHLEDALKPTADASPTPAPTESTEQHQAELEPGDGPSVDSDNKYAPDDADDSTADASANGGTSTVSGDTLGADISATTLSIEGGGLGVPANPERIGDDENADQETATDTSRRRHGLGSTAGESAGGGDGLSAPVTDSEELVEFGDDLPEQDRHFIRAKLGHLSPEQIDQLPVGYSEIKFLASILAATNEELESYSLAESMVNLPGHSSADCDALEEHGYLDPTSVGRKKYYDTTPKTHDLLETSPNVGRGRGDPGEKIKHRVGTYLVSELFKDYDRVARVERYYEYDEDTYFDVVGFDDAGDIEFIIEVETKSNDMEGIRSDYAKMLSVSSNHYWIVDQFSTVTDVIQVIQDEYGMLESVATGRNRSYGDLRDDLQAAVDEMDELDLMHVYGIYELFDMVGE